MNDNQAIHEVDIGSMIKKIPLGFCVLGDAAYTASERLVPTTSSGECETDRW
jgi:hypothetical protein